jgi:hypothetical protein
MDGLNLIDRNTVGIADPAWSIAGTGDFNSDGKSDILLQNNNGQPAVWAMNGLSKLSADNAGSNPGTNWHAVGG